MLTFVLDSAACLIDLLNGTRGSTGNPPKSAEARLSEDQYNYCESTYNNYKYAELFFVGLAGFGTLIGIWLTVDDIIYRKSILHKSHVSKAPAADKADDDDETLLSVQRGP